MERVSISAHLDGLAQELSCPICRDVLETPVARLPCCHYFCQTCINESVRRMSSCPVCKAKIGRRDLSRDETMDRIVTAFKGLHQHKDRIVEACEAGDPSFLRAAHDAIPWAPGVDDEEYSLPSRTWTDIGKFRHPPAIGSTGGENAAEKRRRDAAVVEHSGEPCGGKLKDVVEKDVHASVHRKKTSSSARNKRKSSDHGLASAGADSGTAKQPKAKTGAAARRKRTSSEAAIGAAGVAENAEHQNEIAEATPMSPSDSSMGAVDVVSGALADTLNAIVAGLDHDEDDEHDVVKEPKNGRAGLQKKQRIDRTSGPVPARNAAADKGRTPGGVSIGGGCVVSLKTSRAPARKRLDGDVARPSRAGAAVALAAATNGADDDMKDDDDNNNHNNSMKRKDNDKINETPSTAGRRRIPARLLPWPCGMCTFENKGSETKCGMCGTPKAAVVTPGVFAATAAAQLQAAAATTGPLASNATTVARVVSRQERSALRGAAGSRRDGIDIKQQHQQQQQRKMTSKKSRAARAGGSGEATTLGGTSTRGKNKATSIQQHSKDNNGNDDAAAAAALRPAEQRLGNATSAPSPDENAGINAGQQHGNDVGLLKRWTGVRPSWVLLGSALDVVGRSRLRALAEVSGGVVADGWSPKVTHVVCGSGHYAHVGHGAGADDGYQGVAEGNGEALESGGDVGGANSKLNLKLTAKRTFKYMMGLLHGRWVVSESWVEGCLASGKPVPEHKYEIKRDTYGCVDGPARARARLLTQGKPRKGGKGGGCSSFSSGSGAATPKSCLLRGFEVHLHGQFSGRSKSNLTDLLNASGAKVLARPPTQGVGLPGAVHGGGGVIVVELPDACGDANSAGDAAHSCKKELTAFKARIAEESWYAHASGAGVPVVSHRWVTDSISKYELCSPEEYMV